MAIGGARCLQRLLIVCNVELALKVSDFERARAYVCILGKVKHLHHAELRRISAGHGARRRHPTVVQKDLLQRGKDGLELVMKRSLPKRVADQILEHHAAPAAAPRRALGFGSRHAQQVVLLVNVANFDALVDTDLC